MGDASASPTAALLLSVIQESKYSMKHLPRVTSYFGDGTVLSKHTILRSVDLYAAIPRLDAARTEEST